MMRTQTDITTTTKMLNTQQIDANFGKEPKEALRVDGNSNKRQDRRRGSGAPPEVADKCDQQQQQEGAQQRRRRPLASQGSELGGESAIKPSREATREQQLQQGSIGGEEDECDQLSAAALERSLSDNGADGKKPAFKAELVWFNIFLFVILHSSLPIGLYMLYTRRTPWLTLGYTLLTTYLGGLGVTAGTHRLWSHRSYKAAWPVQVLLVVLQTLAGQNSIYTWSRDHRVHHKFAETDADPHNINRGFFFAHMGWLCCRKHPEVKSKGKLIDMSDLEANPFVMFQHRNFWWMSAMFTVLVPTLIPVFLWKERFWTSFVFSFMIRYLVTLHGTWLVNSAAHYFGSRPYDKRIEARESPFVIWDGLGEGFHNYHHTFPYDYATSEFGHYFNITTCFIDLCAGLGLVHGRRKVDKMTIMKRRLRTGEPEVAHDIPTTTTITTTATATATATTTSHKSIPEDDEPS